MKQPYRQVAFKVELNQYEAFEAFARRLGLAPYTMLKLLVESWAGAEQLMRRLEQGTASEPEGYTELGRLLERIKTVARLNGLFTEMMQRVADHYGLKISITSQSGEG